MDNSELQWTMSQTNNINFWLLIYIKTTQNTFSHDSWSTLLITKESDYGLPLVPIDNKKHF
jgi:hypothetical protein